MQRIAVFSEEFVKIIISLMKWSYVIGVVRSYNMALNENIKYRSHKKNMLMKIQKIINKIIIYSGILSYFA